MVKRLKRRRGSIHTGGHLTSGLLESLPESLPEPIDMNEAEAMLARIKNAVSEEDYAVLRAIVDATPVKRAAAEAVLAKVARLRRLLGNKERE